MKISSIKFLIAALFVSLSIFAQTRDVHIDSNNGIVPPQIDSTIQVLAEQGNLPSLQVLVVRDNQITWSKTYGNEANKNVLYQIGSIEKVITATALLQLYEKGKIDIYADVNEYLPFSVRSPKFPNDTISTIMLLSHRTGLDMFQYQFDWDTKDLEEYSVQKKSLPIQSLPEEDFMKASLDSMGVNYNPDIWMFKPGTNFHYSNSGYFILHYLIEQVSGQTYSEYVTKNIFQETGMNHSVFADNASSANFPNSYTRNGNEDTKLPFRAGMYTNAEDMANFMIAHMTNGKYNGNYLLQPETIELMHKKHSHGKDLFHLFSKCQFPGYGLGIIYYGDKILGHGGSTIGYQSLWSFNKSDKSGYIILTNVNGLIHGKKNFDSVWSTVFSVEKLIKSELGYSTSSFKVYIVFGIIGLIVNIIFFRRRRRIKRAKTNNYPR
ncbi:serine hydrolase domain-containing protein [Sunxiuqinia sp. A32]|uniref:serine hydrolase domain-containing protein n=1 Tax=Sunxiuqinia sp. A32 TaxID=3461496 RepID=UPI0040463B85